MFLSAYWRPPMNEAHVELFLNGTDLTDLNSLKMLSWGKVLVCLLLLLLSSKLLVWPCHVHAGSGAEFPSVLLVVVVCFDTGHHTVTMNTLDFASIVKHSPASLTFFFYSMGHLNCFRFQWGSRQAACSNNARVRIRYSIIHFSSIWTHSTSSFWGAEVQLLYC